MKYRMAKCLDCDFEYRLPWIPTMLTDPNASFGLESNAQAHVATSSYQHKVALMDVMA